MPLQKILKLFSLRVFFLVFLTLAPTLLLLSLLIRILRSATNSINHLSSISFYKYNESIIEFVNSIISIPQKLNGKIHSFIVRRWLKERFLSFLLYIYIYICVCVCYTNLKAIPSSPTHDLLLQQLQGPHASRGAILSSTTHPSESFAMPTPRKASTPKKMLACRKIHLYGGNVSVKNSSLLHRPMLHVPHLAFFAGGVHGPIRPILLNHWKNR
jgi:hypothetical protein